MTTVEPWRVEVNKADKPEIRDHDPKDKICFVAQCSGCDSIGTVIYGPRCCELEMVQVALIK